MLYLSSWVDWKGTERDRSIVSRLLTNGPGIPFPPLCFANIISRTSHDCLPFDHQGHNVGVSDFVPLGKYGTPECIFL